MKKTAIVVIALFLSINITFAKETSFSQLQQKATNILLNYEQQLTDVETEEEKDLFYKNKKTLEKAVNELQPLINEIKAIKKDTLSNKEKEEIKYLTSKFSNLKKISESYIVKDKKIQNIDININKRINFLYSDSNTKNLKEIITKLKETQTNTKLNNFQKFKVLDKIDNLIVETTTMPNYCSLGLKINGNIVLLKNYSNKNLDFSSWTNIKKLSSFENHVLALKEDGTVLSFGENRYGECNTANWKNIKILRSSFEHTVGLKEDGTVVATGRNDFGQCNVSDWKNIKYVMACDDHTIGLQKDGKVVATGNNELGQCNVSDWTDIVDIGGNPEETIGIKANGTMITTNKDKRITDTINDLNSL
jgi:alpha-tubulin suppressor-like RCC1 family protein